MYICVCKGITDNAIRHAVESGAGSFRQVRMQLGVSTQCGQCACHAKALVDETVSAMSDNKRDLFYAA